MAGEQVSTELLRGFAPLDGLKRDNLAALARKVQIRELSPGQLLFKEGDTEKRTIYVVSGILELMDQTKVVGKVEGGTFPSLIWHEIMTLAMQGFEPEPFPTPPGSSTTTTLPEVPEEATVPNLIGSEANEELRTLLTGEPDFWAVEFVEVETNAHPPGTVFNQVPAAGQIVRYGSPSTRMAPEGTDPLERC